MNILRKFDSLSEWVNYSQADQPQDALPEQRASCQTRPEFTGVSTKEEAFRLLREGYPDGLERMKRILAHLSERIVLPTTTDRFSCDVMGCAPNIDAYMQGDPENMFVMSQIEATAPPSILSLQLEIAYSAWITPQQAMWGGAIILAVTQALAMQGCATEIQLTFTTQSHYEGQGVWQTSVPVPRQCDLDTLSFLLTHPSMLRVLCFSIMEHEQPDIREYFRFYPSGGYSRPATQRLADTDAEISMKHLTNRLKFTHEDKPDMDAAISLFNELVATRFNTQPIPQ